MFSTSDKKRFEDVSLTNNFSFLLNLRNAQFKTNFNQWLVNSKYKPRFPTYDDSRIDLATPHSFADESHDGLCIYSHEDPYFTKSLKTNNPPSTPPDSTIQVGGFTLNNNRNYGGQIAYQGHAFAAVLQMFDDMSFSTSFKTELYRGNFFMYRLFELFSPLDDYGIWLKNRQKLQDQYIKDHKSDLDPNVTNPLITTTRKPFAEEQILALPPSDTPIVDADDPYDVKLAQSILRVVDNYNCLLDTRPIWKQPQVDFKLGVVYNGDDLKVGLGGGLKIPFQKSTAKLQVGWSPLENVTQVQTAWKSHDDGVTLGAQVIFAPSLTPAISSSKYDDPKLQSHIELVTSHAVNVSLAASKQFFRENEKGERVPHYSVGGNIGGNGNYELVTEYNATSNFKVNAGVSISPNKPTFSWSLSYGF